MGEESETRTEAFQPVPNAMLVDIGEDLAARCALALQPLRILKVKDRVSACERMLETRPFVIVVGLAGAKGDIEELRARALDISAQVVEVAKAAGPRLEVQLKAALRAAQTLRGLDTPPRADRDEESGVWLGEDVAIEEDE